MRSLKNYVTQITWKRYTQHAISSCIRACMGVLTASVCRTPAAEIADRIVQICAAEGLTVAKNTASRVVELCHGDIRQVINFFQMTKTEDCNSLSYDEAKKRYPF